MDAHVTGSAVLIARIVGVMRGSLLRDARVESPEVPSTVVTFQTSGENGRALEHLGVHGPVRRMTALTAVHAQRTMFEHKRSAFIDVALETGLFIGLSLIHHMRPRCGAPS